MSLQRFFYNLWYYGRRPPPWDTGVSPPELMGFIERRPPGRALDLGCGTGTNVITLAQRGWQATGIDFAWRAIHIARRKAEQAGVHVDLRVGDVTRLEGVRGPFDLILDIGCFHSLSPASRRVYLRNIERLLVGDGTYLLYVFFKPDPAGASPGVVEADLTALAARLRLVGRKDGSERGRRPSAWLAFCLPSAPSSQSPFPLGRAREVGKG